MKSLLPTAALAAAGLLAFAAAANAAPLTVKGSYSLSQSPNVGYSSYYQPTLTNSLSNPFTENLTVGVATTPTNFFIAAPNNHHSYKGTITASFTFTDPSAATGSDTAAFSANVYTDTDSITWTVPGDPIVVSFADGAVLDIILGNDSDWDLNPSISFKLVDPPSTGVPEPGSLALRGAGLFGLGLAWRRRRT